MDDLGSRFRFQISGAPISSPRKPGTNPFFKYSILSIYFQTQNIKLQSFLWPGVNYCSTAIGFSPLGVILTACLLSPSKSKIAL